MLQEQQRELFETFKDDVFRMCLYMVKNREEAEDLTQEVFVKVFCHEVSTITNVKPWLMKLTVNMCRDHFRKTSRLQQKILRIGQFFRAATKQKETTNIVEEEVLATEITTEWSRWLNELPIKYREVIVLRYVNELSQLEISEALTIPIGTVKSRLNRGCNLLRDIVQKKTAPGLIDFPKEELI